MEPKIVSRNEIKLIGMQYIGANQNGEIPALWAEKFIPRADEIKNVVGELIYYGVCECACEGECKCSEGSDFYYTACREVSSFDNVPDGMITKTIPAAKYAVFTHKGPLSELNETYGKVYSEWLPASGLQIAGNYSFEYYDERFCIKNNLELDIYVPVK